MQVIKLVVQEKSAVGLLLALQLGAAFGTTPGFWLNAQQATDVYQLLQTKKN